MIGRVTFFDRKKGYGYIAGDDGRNYFFSKNNLNTSSNSIAKGYMVLFTPSISSRGYEAEDVAIY